MIGRRWYMTLGTVAVMAASAYPWWILQVESSEAVEVDAVVVHAGGRGERLDAAFGLMRDGAAPTLVIMGGTNPEWDAARRLCDGEPGFEVLCPDPRPSNTAGEARTLAALVSDRGWRRVAAVTSDYHLRRVLLLDRSCVPAEVVGIAAESNLGLLRMLPKLAHEMAGMPYSWMFQRCS